MRVILLVSVKYSTRVEFSTLVVSRGLRALLQIPARTQTLLMSRPIQRIIWYNERLAVLVPRPSACCCPACCCPFSLQLRLLFMMVQVINFYIACIVLCLRPQALEQGIVYFWRNTLRLDYGPEHSDSSQLLSVLCSSSTMEPVQNLTSYLSRLDYIHSVAKSTHRSIQYNYSIPLMLTNK